MQRQKQVLVIDDDESVREILLEELQRSGYHGIAASDGSKGLDMLAGAAVPPAAVLLDLRMPGLDGFEVLRRYRAKGGEAPVIALSAMDEREHVVRAMRLGASDYLVKPLEPEALREALDRVTQAPEVVEEATAAAPSSRAPEAPSAPVVQLRRGAPPDFVSQSPAMAGIWDMVDRAADTDVPVLIRGESGVGKEVIARTVHDRSPRRGKPFIKVNCAAIPTELLESELFGHERGAFTGATSEKPGKFELAHGGTIFLDEIGEMHPSLQAKLLQILQDEEYYRVGGKRPLKVDARVVVATNRNLEDEISRGNFREDLYYRLNVVTVHVPALRDRREDIPLLTEHFRKKYGSKYKQPAEFGPEIYRRFGEYAFPGNVRELENLVRRLVVLREERFVLDELAGLQRRAGSMSFTPLASGPAGGLLPPANQSYPPPARDSAPPPAPQVAAILPMPIGANETISLKDIARQAALRAEREAIGAMLARTNWNKRKAAARLQISYKALLYKIKDCGLTDPRLQNIEPAMPVLVTQPR
jgi:DNA-binding NtrC family response regulator